MHRVAVCRVARPYETGSICQAVGLTMCSSGMGDALRGLQRGSTVLVKPNVGADIPSDLGATTDPRVVLGVCRFVEELGLRPVVAESSSIGVDTATALAVEYDVVRAAGYRVLALDGEPTVRVDLQDGGCAVELFRLAGDAAAIVTVPKLKTHDQTTVSLGLKNLKGLLPDERKSEVHRLGLNAGISRLYRALTVGLGRPLFSVLDGLVGMEGLGPVYGTPVHVGIVASSIDALCLDAFGCWMMGIEVRDVEHLEERSFEVAQVPIRPSEEVPPISPLRFKTASDSLADLDLRGITFDWHGACTGCKSTILSVIAEMQYWGQGPPPGICFLAGPSLAAPASPPYGLAHRVSVGNCARGRPCQAHVPGCPPVNEDLSKVLRELEG